MTKTVISVNGMRVFVMAWRGWKTLLIHCNGGIMTVVSHFIVPARVLVGLAGFFVFKFVISATTIPQNTNLTRKTRNPVFDDVVYYSAKGIIETMGYPMISCGIIILYLICSMPWSN